ncbi:hypothetical protein [Promicromonospora sp. MEB111]|uniref:hypothetical protein n=1 Tax=unclassified Promicromonospora TaxID=2647929 RepID=UPI00254AD254|nr:hypothetical protein [Promicromonospora sp. MEB111]
MDAHQVRALLREHGVHLDGGEAEAATVELAQDWLARAARVRVVAERVIPAGEPPITVVTTGDR